MPAAPLTPPLQFELRLHPVVGDRHHRWVVAFARGAVIDCPNENQARVMAINHLARAHRNQIEDAVVSAVWLAPQSSRKPAA